MARLTAAQFLDRTATLTSARYVLRPMCPDDVPDLFRHFSNPRVAEYMDIEPHVSPDETREVVAWATNLRDARNGVRWTVRPKDDGNVLLGTVGLNAIVLDRGCRGEIAYDLDPQYWGRGVMAEAASTVLDFADTVLRLRRIEAMVTPGNERSERLLLRLGFEKEGLLRQYAFWKGRFWDQWLFGKIFVDGG